MERKGQLREEELRALKEEELQAQRRGIRCQILMAGLSPSWVLRFPKHHGHVELGGQDHDYVELGGQDHGEPAYQHHDRTG